VYVCGKKQQTIGIALNRTAGNIQEKNKSTIIVHDDE
jgi:hypothetical protein